MNFKEKIYDLDNKSKVKGEIYMITNNKNGKSYIGQTVTHRKNKGNYRPFGYVSRLNDHISEALCNTKKNQCVYLNNAIRKYGKDVFSVTLLVDCNKEELDDKEKYFIKKFDSLFPNGYNLTKGGQCIPNIKLNNNSKIKKSSKRGRDYGYKHKSSTKKLMSERLKDISIEQDRHNKMKNVMTNFYDNKKVQILSNYVLSDNLEQYIKPIHRKTDKLLHDYVIKINGRKLTVRSKNESLDSKYNRLLNILKEAKRQSK